LNDIRRLAHSLKIPDDSCAHCGLPTRGGISEKPIDEIAQCAVPAICRLAVMAAMGIITAEIFPLPSIAITATAIILVLFILVALCWSKLAATYLIIAAGFFPAAQFHDLEHARPAGSRMNLVAAHESSQQSLGNHWSQKIAPSGFATFLLKLKSIEFEDRKQSTRAVWQVRWKGAPEFGR